MLKALTPSQTTELADFSKFWATIGPLTLGPWTGIQPGKL